MSNSAFHCCLATHDLSLYIRVGFVGVLALMLGVGNAADEQGRRVLNKIMLPVIDQESEPGLPLLAIMTSNTQAPLPPTPAGGGVGLPDEEALALIESWRAEAKAMRDNWEPLRVVLAVWPNGRIIWSDDTILGGAPYREATISAESINQLELDLQALGTFTSVHSVATWGTYGVVSSSMVGLFANGDHFEMTSDHAIYEHQFPGRVNTPRSVALNGRTRATALAEEASPDYQTFRAEWDQLYGRLLELVPETNEKYHPTASDLRFLCQTVPLATPTP